MDILWAFLILAGIGFVLGLGLAICSKVFYVKVDNRVEEITAMLPNANCGGCGFPGCAGFAEAIVNGEVEKLSQCRPGKKEKNFEPIMKFIEENPNEDGTKIKVSI